MALTHSIDPIVLQLGPLTVRWYGVLMALAFLIGYFIVRKLAKDKGMDQDMMEKYFLYMLVGLIAGARLGHIIFYRLDYYLANPLKIFAVWEGGLASHGAMIAGILVTLWFARRNNIRFYNLADVMVIPIALGAMFVRLGNFTNGEIVGRVTSLPWGTKFAGYEGYRHPSQLYEAAKNFALFLFLWQVNSLRNLAKGMIFWLFIWTYAILRFVVEFFKEYQGGWFDGLYGLTTGQWLSAAFFTLSTAAMIWEYRIKPWQNMRQNKNTAKQRTMQKTKKQGKPHDD